jgi:beta-lactamase class D
MSMMVVAAVFAVVGCTSTKSVAGPPGECFLLQELAGGRLMTVNAAECAVARSPASTFKIPHALIALENGVVGADEVVKWDGTKRSNATWERDHTITSAIQWSVFPFFQRTASLIGRERMLAALRSLGYGDASFSGDLTEFWVNGELTVTPLQQLELMRRVFTDDVPMSRANVDVVKAAMVMPPGKITLAAGERDFSLQWPAGTIVRAKTGNTGVEGERVSWLLGHLDANGKQYVFVGRKRATGQLPGTAGAEVALRYLNEFAAREFARH